jgi:predicted nucleotidyltransferase
MFRSANQLRLLAAIFLEPDVRRSISDWVRVSKVTYGIPQASRDIEAAETAGVVLTEAEGVSKLVRANVDSPFFEALQTLLIGSYGVPQLLQEALRPVTAQAELVLLFGSWASRLSGEEGPVPNDIDVLIVASEVDRAAVYGVLDDLEKRLPRAVQVVFRTPEEWSEGSNSFIETVASRPVIRLLPDRSEDEE